MKRLVIISAPLWVQTKEAESSLLNIGYERIPLFVTEKPIEARLDERVFVNAKTFAIKLANGDFCVTFDKQKHKAGVPKYGKDEAFVVVPPECMPVVAAHFGSEGYSIETVMVEIPRGETYDTYMANVSVCAADVKKAKRLDEAVPYIEFDVTVQADDSGKAGKEILKLR